jgi:hypothetical protein
VPYKETESSAAPIMVIRDLATDTGPKPSSDIRSMSADLDDLIAPDLALTLITMYAAPSFTNRAINNHHQFPRVLRSVGSF